MAAHCQQFYHLQLFKLQTRGEIGTRVTSTSVVVADSHGSCLRYKWYRSNFYINIPETLKRHTITNRYIIYTDSPRKTLFKQNVVNPLLH